MDSKMKPMFLPEVEKSPQPSFQADTIKMLQAKGEEYPLILHLFAYRPAATAHLTRFTWEIMRGDSPLTPGFRELIAAHTSAGNHCLF